jgi:integrase
MPEDEAEEVEAQVEADPGTALSRPIKYTARHAVGAYLSSLGRSSKRPVLESLRIVARMSGCADTVPIEQVPWNALTYGNVSEIVGKLKNCDVVRTKGGIVTKTPLAASTINRHIAATRKVLEQCFLMGLLSADEWMRIQALKTAKGSSAMRGREILQKEIKKLLAACNRDTILGARDAAIIALLYGAGLRRFEAANARISDYDSENKKLVVIGKGNKSRPVYFPQLAIAAIDNWLKMRTDNLDRILVRLNWMGEFTKVPRPISGNALQRVAKRLVKMAGVKDFVCHDFRRTFATQQLRDGRDALIVQREMGHASPATTSRYDMRPEEAQAEAAAKLPFPLDW